MGLLSGKVVMITGAGNGIGRECALQAAAAGAKVLVNDPGVQGDGRGGSSAAPAQTVVDAIRDAGGEAIADHGSVADLADVRQMVERCLDAFGGLDVAMNPAGILRDALFHNMEPEDFFAVADLHLRGAYNVAKASIDHFRSRNGGAFLFFTSTSGLIGNLGQSNYAAGKMGVAGLSRILAMEGARRNIRANAIAPFAWTRLVATIPVTDDASRARVERIRTRMRADQVARFCVALASDRASHVTGQLFAVRGEEIHLMSQPRPLRTVTNPSGWTAEQILDHGLPALAGSFYDLGASASAFPGEPA